MTTKHRDFLIFAAVGALVGVSYYLAHNLKFEIGDDFDYWLGVVGGSMMLSMFLYPIRKHMKFARGWGPMTYWFYVHMTTGVLGPLVILVHCKFAGKALNSSVALWCMLLVVLSGFVGRFLYLHSHMDLIKESRELNEFKEREAILFDSVPEIKKELYEFDEFVHTAEINVAGHWFRLLFVLTWHSWVVRYRCTMVLMHEHHEPDLHAEIRELVVQHLTHVMRIALFKSWRSLFQLWHLVHLPFLVMLVITSVVHVISVHAY
jgi:hypothetical protein